MEIAGSIVLSTEKLLEGTTLLVDKPLDWTSFDVVNKIKGACRHVAALRKLKIGHAGTLDPLASGLLVICTGKFTKRIDEFQGGKKEYTGTIFLGKTTPSFDLETAPEGDFETDHITLDLIREAAGKLTGSIMQTPPAYSAKKVDGKRAYKSAHRGIHLEMTPVPVTVFEFEVTRYQFPVIDFRIACSKGTYIRSLAHDLGVLMKSGAYLASLRRTMSEPFNVAEAISLDDLVRQLHALE